MIKTLCWSLTLGQALLWVSPALLVTSRPAVAYTAEDLLTVYWLAGEDYTALARRAEAVARTAAQQGFDTDILLTRVVITVLGQNGGQAAPILKLDVGRNDWRSRPDPRYWSSYYRSAPALLGLEGVAPTGTLQAAPGSSVPAAPGLPVPAAPGSPAPVSPAPEALPEPAPAAAPSPGNSPGSSTIRSPGRSVNQAEPSPSGNPPVINLPALPSDSGIPRSILR